MAYDSEDEATVVFGGFIYGDSRFQGDTWVFRSSTNEWTCMNPISSPTPRNGHSMVYHEAEDLIVMFGGRIGSPWGYSDETWTYDLDRNEWTLLETMSAPEARYQASMVYDSINERVILFGGYREDGPYGLNDTWTFDLHERTWTHIPTVEAPTVRYYSASTFDDVKGAMVLFGGYIDVSPYRTDETWELNVTTMTWTETSPTTSPPELYGSTLVNLPGTGMSMLFGGSKQSSPYFPTTVRWYNSSSETWSRETPLGPAGRMSHQMVFDGSIGRFVLWGGSGYHTRNTVWTYDPGTNEWDMLPTRTSPPPRHEYGLVHDPINDRYILFGGSDGEYFNDTWAYDLPTTTWSWLDVEAPPEARAYFDMVYDSTNEVVVLFGGKSKSTSYLGDTWEFDVTTDTWTRTSTSGPTARKDHAMAYDPGADRTVLFGGSSSGVSYRTDTMEYDASSNSWYSGGTGPAGRRDHAMAYFGDVSAVVLFGGRGSTGTRNDTWEYTASTDTWSSKTPSNPPSKRENHAMAYDPVKDLVWLYGGYDSGYRNETYIYYVSGSSRSWSLRSNYYPSPDGRYSMDIAFDVKGNCVLFGGYSWGFNDDTWHLTDGGEVWRLDIPPSRLQTYNVDLLYDPVSERIIQFGNGRGYSHLFWTISPEDGSVDIIRDDSWSSYRPVPVFESHCEVIPLTGEVFVFGGTYYGTSGWVASNWTRLYTLGGGWWDEVSESVGPHYLDYASMAFDRTRGVVVLFGGYYYESGSHYLNETWTFNVSTEKWIEASPASSPTARYGHVMVWDDVNERVLVHGGRTENDPYSLADTWAYDIVNDTWVELATGPVLNFHSGDFDQVRGELVVWGGTRRSGTNDDIWRYDVRKDVWTKITLSHGPFERYQQAMVYDPVEDVFLMHGGYYYDGMDSFYMSDIWRLIPDANEKNGIYTSSAIGPEDGPVQWGTISWCDLSDDEEATVRAQIAADHDGVSGEFVGPDGTPGTYFTVSSGEMIHPGTISRFLRYRLYLETTHAGRTPEITGVSVTYETVTTPTVTLHSPNGGEDLMESGSHIVTWTGDGDLNATPIQLHYSTDGGTSWTLTGSWMTNTGHYNWSVPSVETATGLVRVSVTDVYGNTVSDVSDMTFAIDPPANWQLPGTGGNDGTGDGTGDGEDDDGPTTSGDSGGGIEGAGDPTTLWIVVAAEGVAIAVLTVFLVMVTANGYTRRKRRR